MRGEVEPLSLLRRSASTCVDSWQLAERARARWSPCRRTYLSSARFGWKHFSTVRAPSPKSCFRPSLIRITRRYQCGCLLFSNVHYSGRTKACRQIHQIFSRLDFNYPVRSYHHLQLLDDSEIDSPFLSDFCVYLLTSA